MPPSYIRVRAVMWAYGRGQPHRHTDARGFVDDVMFSHNEANTETGHWRIIHRDLPGGAGDEVCYRRSPRFTLLYKSYSSAVSGMAAHG